MREAISRFLSPPRVVLEPPGGHDGGRDVLGDRIVQLEGDPHADAHQDRHEEEGDVQEYGQGVALVFPEFPYKADPVPEGGFQARAGGGLGDELRGEGGRRLARASPDPEPRPGVVEVDLHPVAPVELPHRGQEWVRGDQGIIAEAKGEVEPRPRRVNRLRRGAREEAVALQLEPIGEEGARQVVFPVYAVDDGMCSRLEIREEGDDGRDERQREDVASVGTPA